MESRARSIVFCPGMTNDIRAVREHCYACNRSAPVSRFECVSGLSVYWPIIALGTRECGVAQLCRDPTVQSEFSFVSRFSKHLIEFIAIDS